MSKLLLLLSDPQVQALIAAGISALVGWWNRDKIIATGKDASLKVIGACKSVLKSTSKNTPAKTSTAADDGRLDLLHGLCNIADSVAGNEEALKAVKALFPIVGVKE